MARKGECKIVLENYLQRKCSYIWQIFTKYKKEYAQLMLYEDGSSVIEFKTDVNGRVKFRYEMESCIGVYLRVQMDQARADWPVNSNPECCFTLINHDDNNVFLVADESKIAHRWAWKLSEYSKAPQTVRKSNEEFSINDLIDVFDVLNDEPSLLSCDPSSWKFLGRNLGLADDTLQKIEDFHDTTEDQLYFCLLKWIKRSDKVDEKGGPTHLILVESLKKMKKEEIAERVFKKFSHKIKIGSVKSSSGEISEIKTLDVPKSDVSPNEDEISSTDVVLERPGATSQKPKRVMSSVDVLPDLATLQQLLDGKKDPIKHFKSSQLEEEKMPDDYDDEGETVIPKRERASTIAGRGRDEAQALTEVNKFRTLMGALNHKLRKEMAYFSNTNISSHITVNNETPHPMMYHKCFLVRGHISGYQGLNENIPPKSNKCFSFEKYSSLSLDGCAGMIFLSATTCENTACYFVIAFRNYVKFKSLTRNKAALLILNDAKSMDKISDSQSFGKIMRNKKENPHKDIDGCYKGDVYNPPFMAASLDESGSHDFRNICFRIGMIDNPSDSKVNVTVEHPNQLG